VLAVLKNAFQISDVIWLNEVVDDGGLLERRWVLVLLEYDGDASDRHFGTRSSQPVGQSDFDEAAAHRFFSATCFNRTWELLDKPERTPEETEAMIACSLSSLWHWRQRPDCSRRNLSIGYWQVSRVYAVAGQAQNAWRYGELCLKASEGEEPFYLGYGYEAMARAARLAGELDLARQYLRHAEELAGQLSEGEEREMLTKDLNSLVTEG